MRHTDENISMFEHLRISAEVLNTIKQQAYSIMDRHQYFFAQETKQHLDYVFRVFNAPQKLNLPAWFINIINKHIKGQNSDRFYYSLYKLRHNIISLLIYLFRKSKKQFISRFPILNIKTKHL